MFTVRTALPSDFEDVTALLGAMGRDECTGETENAFREGYLDWLGRHDTDPLVAELGGHVVGFMSLEYRLRLNRLAPQAWVPDLVVSEAARGQGVGMALVQEGICRAENRSCFSFTLESGYWRTAAHRLYERAELHDAGKYFYLALPRAQRLTNS